MATTNKTLAAELALQKAYGPSSMLPPTDNKALLTSTLSLYNPTLFLVCSALFQHTVVLAFIFLLRGFSTKRVFDIHFLTIVFNVTLMVGSFVFLINHELDRVKLLFFLEHITIEVVICVRVLFPADLVARRPGLILFVLYTGLFGVTLPIMMHDIFSETAMAVAWTVFPCDCCLGIAGIVTIKRWLTDGRRGCSRTLMRKRQAEALAGLGFMLHGFVTMSVGPIFTLVLYDGLDPNWFAYAWVGVFGSAFFTIAFAVPSTALFFSNIWWCCGSRRSTYLGDIDWQEERIQEKPRHRIPSPMPMFRRQAGQPGSRSSVEAYQVEAGPNGMQVQRLREDNQWELRAKPY